MTYLLAIAFSVSIGFACAGFAASLYRLILNKQLTFQLVGETTVGLFFGILMLVFAGPGVIMRNALRAQIVEDRPPVWFCFSSLIALRW